MHKIYTHINWTKKNSSTENFYPPPPATFRDFLMVRPLEYSAWRHVPKANNIIKYNVIYLIFKRDYF